MRIGGAAGVALALCAAAMIPVDLHAACRSPLPTESLRGLDARIDVDPAGVLSEARSRLNASHGSDTLQAAELYVLIADANSVLDDDAQARIAVAEGRSQLLSLPDSDAKRSLQIWLDVTEADSSQNTTDMAVSADHLTQLEQSLPTQSLDRACLLIVRSRLNTQLIRDEEATTDGIAAYRLATALKAPGAIADAAYQLAFTYLRAGLLDDADSLVSEANAYYKATGKTARLSDGLYIRADILEQMRQYDRALTVNAEARALNLQQHEIIDVAFDDQKKCSILLSLQRLEAARQTCAAAEPVLAAAGRSDLVATIEGSLARIDIIRGQPAAAIVRLDRVLESGVDRVPAKVLPKLYQYRSEALDHVGRFKDALRDLQEAARLSEAGDAARHSLAAARLKERATAAIDDQDRQALETQMRYERQEAVRQANQWRLRLVLAMVLGFLLVLTAYLMWKRARQEHALRQAGETLESQAHVISTVPDGVLLVDGLGQIKYANPASLRLFGRSQEEFLGHSVEELGIRFGILRSQGADTKVTSPNGAYELQLTDAHGKPLSVLLTCSSVALHDHALTVCILRDVTVLRRLERRVFSEVSGARAHMSNEIHEALAEELTGISLLLKGIAGRSNADESKLAYVRNLMCEVIENAQAFMQGLSPVQIALGSLPSALSRFAEEQTLARGHRVTSHFDMGELQLSLWQADHLFRIAQGCTELALRNRDSGDIDIDLRLVGDGLTLAVTNSRAVGAEQCIDDEREWEMIVYLTNIIGGAANVEVLPNKGTRRTVTIPLAALMMGAAERLGKSQVTSE